MKLAFVWTGNKYSIEYVENLISACLRHWPKGEPFELLAITDRPGLFSGAKKAVDCNAYRLNGWWAKLLLLSKEVRGDGRTIYLDLDTVITGSLAPLFGLDVEFGTLRNFTNEAGISYPCKYGSAVMSIRSDFDMWEEFAAKRDSLIEKAGRYGDQAVIENLPFTPTILQDLLPGYFTHYRYHEVNRAGGEERGTVVSFGGNPKPHEAPDNWVQENWRG